MRDVIGIPFISPDERYLLIELFPDRAAGVFLRLDKDRRLTVERDVEEPTPQRVSAFLGRRRGERKVIVSADASLTHTAVLPVRIARSRGDKPLESHELEGLIAQAVGKVFPASREVAGRELGVDEIDVVLVGSKVVSFRIDGHRVLNPVGFSPRRIEAVLELSLATRDTFERLKTILGGRRRFYFTEPGRAVLRCLERVRGLPIRFLSLGPGVSRYFIMDGAAVGYAVRRGRISWPADAFPRVLAREFGMSSGSAERLYAEYRAGKLSPRAERHVHKVLEPAVKALFAELARTPLRGTLFFHAAYPPPFTLPYKKGRFVIEELPVAVLLDRIGVDVSRAPHDGPGQASLLVRLAPIFEYFACRDESEINTWLRRHLMWLGGSG